MTLFRAFLLSVAAAMSAVIAYAFVIKPDPAAGQILADRVFVRDQVTVADVARLPDRGFRTLVDLRPDGEEGDQPTSVAIGDAARTARLGFAYIPVPHGDIPDAAADDLARILATAEKPVLLYCRSGKRATRTWALAVASLKGGPSAPEIATVVRAARQVSIDLMPRIEARIAARH